jgi:hypothetical protein
MFWRAYSGMDTNAWLESIDGIMGPGDLCRRKNRSEKAAQISALFDAQQDNINGIAESG